MVSLLIITMLFGTLVPTMQKMHQSLESKQLRGTAYETMHEAAKVILSTGASSGERTVNEVLFKWEYGSELCVSYLDYRLSPVTICER